MARVLQEAQAPTERLLLERAQQQQHQAQPWLFGDGCKLSYPPLNLGKVMTSRSESASGCIWSLSPGTGEKQQSTCLPAELIHGSQQTERWRSAVIEWNNILCRDFKYFSFRDKLGFN